MISRYTLKIFLVLFLSIIGGWINFLRAQAPNINYPGPSPQILHVNTSAALTPVNSGGAVPMTTYGTVTTIAGTGTLGYADGPNTSAQFNIPEAVTKDAAGNLYVADYNNNAIRKITPAGVVSTIAGSPTGAAGFVNGIGTAALFNGPDGIAIDPSGNYLYVADYNNNVIRKIALADGTVSTFVTGIQTAYGLCFDAAGNLLVAGYDSYKIFKITPAGVVTPVAGSSWGYVNSTIPASAEFEEPEDVQTDAAGNIYVADYWNNAIRKISPSGAVTTFAGSDVEGNTPGWADGAGTAAQFNHPTGVALGNGNVIYVADLENNDIRRILPDGTVSTVAGNQTAGAADGTGTSATFYHPVDLYIDHTGVGYIADARNGNIRKIVLTGYTIDKPLPAGLSFDPTTGQITGAPTSLSLLQSYTITAYNGEGFSKTTIKIAVAPPADPIATPPSFTYTIPPRQINKSLSVLPVAQPGGGPVPATEFGQVTTITSGTSFSNLWGIDIRTDVNGTKSLIVADVNQVWKMDINGTGVSTLAGTGAGIGLASGLSVSLIGDVFVGDVANKSLKKITYPAGAVTNNPGNGIVNFDPEGVATDLSGNVFVADRQGNVIREFKADGTSGVFAGNGNTGEGNGSLTSATFNGPTDNKFDQSGNLFIADQNGNMIREINTAGNVTTYAGGLNAGSQNGPISTALFNKPIALAVDIPGGVYVSDQGGHIIRMIDKCGMVVPVAGDVLRQISADGIGAEAAFTKVSGLTYSNGALYAADKTSVRKILVTGYVIDHPLPAGLSFNSSTGEISGTSAVAINEKFTVTGFNTGGCYSTDVNIEFDDIPPSITYPPGNFVESVGDIVTIAPINKGGAAIYTIVPANSLPPGLTFDPNTGIISGIPTSISFLQSYTITAQNSAGSSIANISITVVKKGEVITFNTLPVKTYGDPDFDPGATSNDSGAPITYTTGDPNVATIVNGLIHITGTGTVQITASQGGDADYAPATDVVQTLTVNKAPLTIKADDQSRQTGEANPVLTATYTGFVYGESVTQLTTLPVLNTSATINSPAGTYPITISGATATNYIITEQPGTLTVTPAHPLVTIPNAFTPNGDGFNDLWNIKSIESYPKCIVSVYNRYGNLIYQSRGYANSWDGTYNGSPVPTGTYYYIIDLGDNSNKLSGYVAVIR